MLMVSCCGETQRPLAVIDAKEDRDQVLRPLIPLIEADIVSVIQNGFTMKYMEKDMHVTVESDLAMFDGKMYAALQGTGGAFCQMCTFTKENCHCKEHVLNGFPVDRNIQDMHRIFSMLTGDGAEPINKRPDDYGTRAGITAEPITHRPLNAGISVIHAWLYCCTWFLHILYHLVANDKTWGFGNKALPRYQKLMKAKKKVQDTFKVLLGRLIDTADGTGHTGNSLTGNLAKRFFADNCRALLVKLVKEPELGHIKKLHMHFDVILRIISSKNRKIDMNKFGNLCTSTYIDILTHFDWVDLTPTVHKVLAHSAELVANNLCMGIGHLSEEGLEACHKIIRRFRSSWTLQTSDQANLKDLIKKLWLSSDPLFYSYRRVLECPKCGSKGHKRKCPVFEENLKQTESDIMVEDCFVD